MNHSLRVNPFKQAGSWRSTGSIPIPIVLNTQNKVEGSAWKTQTSSVFSGQPFFSSLPTDEYVMLLIKEVQRHLRPTPGITTATLPLVQRQGNYTNFIISSKRIP